MIERRTTPRHEVRRTGTIEFAGGTATCVIRNISPMGAALDVSRASSIPHEITLRIADGQLSQHCYIVWRKPTCVGVAFDRLNEPDLG